MHTDTTYNPGRLVPLVQVFNLDVLAVLSLPAQLITIANAFLMLVMVSCMHSSTALF